MTTKTRNAARQPRLHEAYLYLTMTELGPYRAGIPATVLEMTPDFTFAVSRCIPCGLEFRVRQIVLEAVLGPKTMREPLQGPRGGLDVPRGLRQLPREP